MDLWIVLFFQFHSLLNFLETGKLLGFPLVLFDSHVVVAFGGRGRGGGAGNDPPFHHQYPHLHIHSSSFTAAIFFPAGLHSRQCPKIIRKSQYKNRARPGWSRHELSTFRNNSEHGFWTRADKSRTYTAIHTLQPWQARFKKCGNADYFWDSVPGPFAHLPAFTAVITLHPQPSGSEQNFSTSVPWVLTNAFNLGTPDLNLGPRPLWSSSLPTVSRHNIAQQDAVGQRKNCCGLGFQNKLGKWSLPEDIFNLNLSNSSLSSTRLPIGTVSPPCAPLIYCRAPSI